jgi:hypothetical protein
MGMTTKLSGAENDRLHSTASRTTREMYDGGGGGIKAPMFLLYSRSMVGLFIMS